MIAKILCFACFLIVFCILIPTTKGKSLNKQKQEWPEIADQIFENITTSNDVLVLIPSTSNITGSFIGDLFKLDSELLITTPTEHKIELESDEDAESSLDSTSDQMKTSGLYTEGRNSRKINLLRGVLNKPKISPLYLVNGTVCRFVNSAPICTTLATTGLLPTNSVSGGAASRPTTSGQSSGGSSVQFANQSIRPAALIDEDPQDINVESSLNPTNTSVSIRGQQQSAAPQQNQPARPVNNIALVQARPAAFMMNRRPLNLLSLRRPIRQYQVNGRSQEKS